MAIEVTAEYIRPETVRLMAYIYDDDAALVDPTAFTCTIIDSAAATQVDDAAMTKKSTGIYEYFYNLAADAATGWWKCLVKIVDGTGETAKTTIGTTGFNVES